MISDINDPDAKNADDSSKETPKGAQAGKSSVSSTPVSSSSFYGQKATTSGASNMQSNSNTMPGVNVQSNVNTKPGVNVQSNINVPPALPKRDQASAAGSSYTHTMYAPPGSTFESSNSYRESEIQDDWDMPALMPARGAGDSSVQGAWGSSFDAGSVWDQPDFARLESGAWGGGAGEREPAIDGRNHDEELRWWDPTLHQKNGAPRPGYGMLAPLLADMLHNPEHTLVNVSVTPPDIFPTSAASGSTSSVASVKMASPPSSPAAKSTHSRSSSTSQVPPTAQEVREAIPHPHAHYCRRHNGWVLLAWRSSSVLPPVVDSHRYAFPDPIRRKGMHNCLDETPFDKPNKTHHFHHYPKAVDAQNMSPGYIPRSFEKAERAKQARRRMTVGSAGSVDLSSETLERALRNESESKMEADSVTEAKEEEQAVNLLDLFLCCQCSLYVVCSDVIPGVIPAKYVEDFVVDKTQNPSVGKTSEQCVHSAWETILTIIENKLWKGNHRSLAVDGRSFSSKVGWSSSTKRIFESIGFSVTPTQTPEGTKTMLIPPNVDPNTKEGLTNRERLLRAWVEIGAMVIDYRRRFPNVLKDYSAHPVWVKTENAREMYQSGIGAHNDQIKRNPLPEGLHMIDLSHAWNKLGMTQSTYDPDLVHFAYLAQKRCDPYNTPEYLQALCDIVSALEKAGEYPTSLVTLIAAERSRGRFTVDDVKSAVAELGFGADNALRVDYDEDVDDNFLVCAWRDALRRSWADPNSYKPAQGNDINEAFRIIAMYRHSPQLVKMVDEDARNGMTPDKAYQTLEVPQGVDEEMLITVYNMRVEDQPSSLDRMRAAMQVIAEFQQSERLQAFLNTGTDPGTVVATARPDWPRGLNQLGNTCYLNSLLQYLYTIKDLREAISPFVVEDKYMDSDKFYKFKDDELKNHRVGGRIVSRHEVIRSRRFVSQLANLFWQMEYGEAPAVTPSLELAKLALVTSKDEEEDDPERGTDSSNSTDATLVDETVPTAAPTPTPALPDSESPSPTSKSPSPSSPPPSMSVLGKRPRGFGRKKSAGADERPSRGGTPTPTAASPTAEDEGEADVDVDTPDVAVTARPDLAIAGASTPATATSAKAPPLPPRPKAATSDMMFGKQHDVAECMDNCMFQIETALLRFGELASPGAGPEDNSKRSIVKRLFYGKIRQRLAVEPDATRKTKSSLHEREDYFSHLPVNVSEESFDLYDGLSGYFDDTVEYEGTKARMEVSLVELPPILQIQLQRVQFNRDTLQPYKSHAYVKFGESICMDRFLDDAPAEKKAQAKKIQQELSTCRDRLSVITQGKHAPYETALIHASAFLRAPDTLDLPEATSTLADTLQAEAAGIVSEIAALRARIGSLKTQLEDVWRGEARAEYVLTSVFVHSGVTPSFGHYFIYQRRIPLPSEGKEGGEEWFKYNDSDVGVVNAEEVLADTTGSIANPYLLVFTRKDADVIETVHRAEPMLIE